MLSVNDFKDSRSVPCKQCRKQMHVSIKDRLCSEICKRAYYKRNGISKRDKSAGEL